MPRILPLCALWITTIGIVTNILITGIIIILVSSCYKEAGQPEERFYWIYDLQPCWVHFLFHHHLWRPNFLYLILYYEYTYLSKLTIVEPQFLISFTSYCDEYPCLFHPHHHQFFQRQKGGINKKVMREAEVTNLSGQQAELQTIQEIKTLLMVRTLPNNDLAFINGRGEM